MHDDSLSLDAALAEATKQAIALPVDRRAEHVGLYLVAKADGGRLPQAPEATGVDVDATELEQAVASAVAHATSQQATDAPVAELLRCVGERLCPKAAQIPADAYLTAYPHCRAPPYIIQIDAFLLFPGPGYHFSMPRVTEAKRQSWELIRAMKKEGKCDRLVLMGGNPAVGKSTWITKVGALEDGAATTIFFDDLCNNKFRRRQFWDGFMAADVDLPVECVFITRDFERACVSNRTRGSKGGHEVPQPVMERYRDDVEAPSVDEGFARVRIFDNEFDEASGEGEYVLKPEGHAERTVTLSSAVR
eukprot:5665596-Prymnesium_polylepis.1